MRTSISTLVGLPNPRGRPPDHIIEKLSERTWEFKSPRPHHPTASALKPAASIFGNRSRLRSAHAWFGSRAIEWTWFRGPSRHWAGI